MNNSPIPPKTLLQFKGNKITQAKIVFRELKKTPMSRRMVGVETNIYTPNICRYVAKWRERDLVAVAKKDFCKVSGEMVEYLTTNPDLFNTDQLNLFSHE